MFIHISFSTLQLSVTYHEQDYFIMKDLSFSLIHLEHTTRLRKLLKILITKVRMLAL